MAKHEHWQGWDVLEVTELAHAYQVKAHVLELPTQCPYCEHSVTVGFGRRNDSIVDMPVRGKHVEITISRRRFRCQACGRTFLQAAPLKDGKRQMTRRLIEHIESECSKRAFTDVATEVGVDEKTVRNVYKSSKQR